MTFLSWTLKALQVLTMYSSNIYWVPGDGILQEIKIVSGGRAGLPLQVRPYAEGQRIEVRAGGEPEVLGPHLFSSSSYSICCIFCPVHRQVTVGNQNSQGLIQAAVLCRLA